MKRKSKDTHQLSSTPIPPPVEDLSESPKSVFLPADEYLIDPPIPPHLPPVPELQDIDSLPREQLIEHIRRLTEENKELRTVIKNLTFRYFDSSSRFQNY